jgi:hypothetical protein
MKAYEHPGINMQAPWCELLLSGEKTIETRSYPLPDRLKHQWIWLIETPGPKGKFKARVRGRIKFYDSFEYRKKSDWIADFPRHRVRSHDPLYAYQQGKRKFGWLVEDVEPCQTFFNPPKKRGIVYTKSFTGFLS